MNHTIDIIALTFLFVMGTDLLPLIGSLVFIAYYISMLKLNVVDKKYKGSWNQYLKSILKWKKKKKE